MIFDAVFAFMVLIAKSALLLLIDYTPPNMFDLTLISAASQIVPITETFVFFGWMLTYASATTQYLIVRWVVRIFRGA